MMSNVGPLGDDGCVEFTGNPAGRGYRYQTLGMLSKHPQCDAIRRALKAAGHGDWPDEPLVVDYYCPFGMAYFSPGWGAIFVNPRGPIEQVLVIPAETAHDIAAGMGLLPPMTAQQHVDNTPSCSVCGYAPQVRGCVPGKCGRTEP